MKVWDYPLLFELAWNFNFLICNPENYYLLDVEQAICS